MSFPTGALEQNATKLTFALLLRDRLNFSNQLAGDITVTAGLRAGRRKGISGTFLFFDLPNGAANFAVRSGADALYYLPADIAITLPPASPNWPTFPDAALANPVLPLWDPGQPAAYRKQFLQACLTPSVAYPFEPGATLLRGTVTHAGVPVAGATVADLTGTAPPSLTGESGEFVLAFTTPAGSPASVTIRTQGGGSPSVDTLVTIRRATTTAVRISV